MSIGPRLDHLPATLFDPDEAERKAAELADSDPDWNFEVRHDPSGKGKSYIVIRDENLEWVGVW